MRPEDKCRDKCQDAKSGKNGCASAEGFTKGLKGLLHYALAGIPTYPVIEKITWSGVFDILVDRLFDGRMEIRSQKFCCDLEYEAEPNHMILAIRIPVKRITDNHEISPAKERNGRIR